MPNLRTRLEPFITPFFRVWWRFSRGMTLGVRGIATDAEGRVLLVKHTYRDGWFLPGGGVESREVLVDSLIREMEEEGGVRATSQPRLIGIFANHAAFKNDHVALYQLDAWEPCATQSEYEIAERGFFPVDALPHPMNRGSRDRIAELFKGAPQSAHW